MVRVSRRAASNVPPTVSRPPPVTVVIGFPAPSKVRSTSTMSRAPEVDSVPVTVSGGR